MALTVHMDQTERMIVQALTGLTVAYGGELGTQPLEVRLPGQPDPQGATVPWARLVAFDEGNLRGNTGIAEDGSSGELVITLNVTSPDVATRANRFALSRAISVLRAALRQDRRRSPVAGQTQRVRFDRLRSGIDPDPDRSDGERTGYVVATAIVSIATD